eukprot:191443-Chlamydomonas_euryale.AAC.4
MSCGWSTARSNSWAHQCHTWSRWRTSSICLPTSSTIRDPGSAVHTRWHGLGSRGLLVLENVDRGCTSRIPTHAAC